MANYRPTGPGGRRPWGSNLTMNRFRNQNFNVPFGGFSTGGYPGMGPMGWGGAGAQRMMGDRANVLSGLMRQRGRIGTGAAGGLGGFGVGGFGAPYMGNMIDAYGRIGAAGIGSQNQALGQIGAAHAGAMGNIGAQVARTMGDLGVAGIQGQTAMGVTGMEQGTQRQGLADRMQRFQQSRDDLRPVLQGVGDAFLGSFGGRLGAPAGVGTGAPQPPAPAPGVPQVGARLGPPTMAGGPGNPAPQVGARLGAPAGANTGGGTVAGPSVPPAAPAFPGQPTIDANPLYRPGDTEATMRSAMGQVGAAGAAQANQMINQFGNRGFAGGSGALAHQMAVPQQMARNQMGQLAFQIPLQHNLANAQHMLNAQQAQEGQFATRQREGIGRQNVLASIFNPLIGLYGQYQ